MTWTERQNEENEISFLAFDGWKHPVIVSFDGAWRVNSSSQDLYRSLRSVRFESSEAAISAVEVEHDKALGYSPAGRN